MDYFDKKIFDKEQNYKGPGEQGIALKVKENEKTEQLRV